MRAMLLTKESFIWLVLILLTGISWLVADGYQHETADHYLYFTAGLMALAFFKVRLVVMHFMEIGYAPLPLRLLFEAWVIIVPLVILFLHLDF